MFKLIRLLTLAGFLAVAAISYPMWRGFLPANVQAMLPAPAGQTPNGPRLSTPPPLPTAIPANTDPIVIVTPATPRPTAAPTAAPTPIFTPPPAATPTPRPVIAWSGDDCPWAMQILTEDAAWDRATAAAIADGTETRYPQSDIPVYQAYASAWASIAGYVGGVCNRGQYPTAAQDANALSWFAEASAGHSADAAQNPANAPWDDQWISNYARLTGLFSDLPH